ncbi:MAG: hypothetical protein JO006_20855 [Paucibacter sp.]|nr:hypothetical protein [Roseateles sp.]
MRTRLAAAALPLATLLAALLASLLAGCATPVDDPRLMSGRSTVAEVQALYGMPTRVWPEADGGQTLEFAQQPFGTHCYLLRFDAAGHLAGRRDGLAPAERARVVPGMSIEQVQRLLGRERTRVHFSLSGEDVWDWNVEPPYAAMWLRLNVHFKDGVVVKTTEILVDPDRPHRNF